MYHCLWLIYIVVCMSSKLIIERYKRYNFYSILNKIKKQKPSKIKG